MENDLSDVSSGGKWSILHYFINEANQETFIVFKDIIEIVPKYFFLENMIKSDHSILQYLIILAQLIECEIRVYLL